MRITATSRQSSTACPAVRRRRGRPRPRPAGRAGRPVGLVEGMLGLDVTTVLRMSPSKTGPVWSQLCQATIVTTSASRGSVGRRRRRSCDRRRRAGDRRVGPGVDVRSAMFRLSRASSGAALTVSPPSISQTSRPRPAAKWTPGTWSRIGRSASRRRGSGEPSPCRARPGCLEVVGVAGLGIGARCSGSIAQRQKSRTRSPAWSTVAHAGGRETRRRPSGRGGGSGAGRRPRSWCAGYRRCSRRPRRTSRGRRGCPSPAGSRRSTGRSRRRRPGSGGPAAPAGRSPTGQGRRRGRAACGRRRSPGGAPRDPRSGSSPALRRRPRRS